MKALWVDALGARPRLRELDEPTRERASDCSLVEIRAAVLGHIDLQLIRGEIAVTPTFPIVPGSEGAGIVLASDAFAAGTAVRIRGGGAGVRTDGTWADLAVLPDAALTAIPALTTDATQETWALAAAFFSPVATAWAAVHDVAGVTEGERVLITGAAGAVGAAAVQIAAQAGGEVVGLVGSPAKRGAVPAVAKAMSYEEWDAERDQLGRFDAVVDTVGGTPLARAVASLRPGGRVALVGYTAGSAIEVPISELLLRDVSLLPTNLLRRGAALSSRGDEWFEVLLRGDMDLAVHSFDLADFDGAIAALESRDIDGRIVLAP